MKTQIKNLDKKIPVTVFCIDRMVPFGADLVGFELKFGDNWGTLTVKPVVKSISYGKEILELNEIHNNE